MTHMEDALERIKKLECAVGEVENRVAGILQDYGISEKEQITVNKERDSDEGYAVYRCDIAGDINKSLVVSTKAGADDYVAIVTDVYLN